MLNYIIKREIMMSLKLQDGVNGLPLQIKQVKMTKQMWDKLSLDTRADMLMSVVKDPDEAEVYTEYEWDQLPSEVVSNMLIHVK